MPYTSVLQKHRGQNYLGIMFPLQATHPNTIQISAQIASHYDHVFEMQRAGSRTIVYCASPLCFRANGKPRSHKKAQDDYGKNTRRPFMRSMSTTGGQRHGKEKK